MKCRLYLFMTRSFKYLAGFNVMKFLTMYCVAVFWAIQKTDRFTGQLYRALCLLAKSTHARTLTHDGGNDTIKKNMNSSSKRFLFNVRGLGKLHA